MQRFGATLRQYREEYGLSQRVLAARAHLNRTYIYDIERGKYNLSVLTLLRLAKALGIPSSCLLAGLNPNDPLPPRETQAAVPSTTSFLTPADQATLLSLLGTTIRQYRQHHPLTQPGLAAKTDLTAPYISQIEGGTRNITILTLLRLADALALSVHDLLTPLDTYQRSSPPLPE